jgi:hypothetical protein
MKDNIRLIVLGLVGLAGSFVVFIVVFYVMFSMKSQDAPAPAQAAPAQAPPQSAAPAARPAAGQASKMAGGEVLAYSDVLGENIPLEPKVDGYDWAKWGMPLDQVMATLKTEGQKELEVYSPDSSTFISVVSLNPDEKRYKVEYRFYNKSLFHVEVFYSAFFKNNSFNAFLLDKMREYGRPYEQYATVDEMGRVILHAKWDTEDSLIELLSRPNGLYALFLDSQATLIQLEEARKTEERLKL